MNKPNSTDVKKQPALSVVIVNWNTCRDVTNCLETFCQFVQPDISTEVIVVDNASSDDSAVAIPVHFPHVRFLTSSENVGFSAANNVGIKSAQGEFILLLNPDTLFIEDCVSPLLKQLRADDSIGMIGCRLLNGDSSDQQSVDLYPYPFQEINVLSKQRRRAFLRKIETVRARGAHCTVEVMIGAFMMIRRSLLVEIGMLDTRFFMYAEDVDLCFRVRRSNRKIVFDSSRSLVHLGGTSSQQRWNDRQRIDTVRHSLFLMQCKHFGKAVASCSLVCRYLYSTIRLLQIRLVTSSPETRAIYESDAAANARLLGRLPEILRSASVKGS